MEKDENSASGYQSPKSDETPRVIDNRHERRRQAKFAKLRAKRAVAAMRAQGIDFIHDKF